MLLCLSTFELQTRGNPGSCFMMTGSLHSHETYLPRAFHAAHLPLPGTLEEAHPLLLPARDTDTSWGLHEHI